jgi:hypothetical protein
MEDSRALKSGKAVSARERKEWIIYSQDVIWEEFDGLSNHPTIKPMLEKLIERRYHENGINMGPGIVCSQGGVSAKCNPVLCTCERLDYSAKSLIVEMSMGCRMGG